MTRGTTAFRHGGGAFLSAARATAAVAAALTACWVTGTGPAAAAPGSAPPRREERLSAAPVTAPPPELVRKLRLSPFYRKHLDCGGLPILSSAKVSDDALRRAGFLIDRMLTGRSDLRRAIVQAGVRFAVMAPTEKTTDVPEHSDLTPKEYWDGRARGLGATTARPAVSCGEENLLNLPGDRYDSENILVHEFAHVIHQMGLSTTDPTFEGRLNAAYQRARAAGRWKGAYAAENPAEYWAEGVQSYFDTNRANDGQHNHVDTREELAEYDTELFRLIDGVFRGSEWRFTRYDGRTSPRPDPAAVSLTVVNDSGAAATFFWLDGARRVRYRTLAPGERYVQSTYAGHRWRAEFADGRTPSEYTAPEGATPAPVWTLTPVKP